MRALCLVGLVAAAAAFLLGACAEEEATPTPSPQDGGPLNFDTIAKGDQSGIVGERPQVFKIASQAEWEGLWSRHQTFREAKPAPPTVDFSREVVVAAVDRQEPSGGYRFEIMEIREEGGSLVVRVSKEVPGPECIVTAVITQPFHIVRLARSDLEPRLVIDEGTYSCD